MTSKTGRGTHLQSGFQGRDEIDRAALEPVRAALLLLIQLGQQSGFLLQRSERRMWNFKGITEDFFLRDGLKAEGHAAPPLPQITHRGRHDEDEDGDDNNDLDLSKSERR